ncbi:MAG: hypothetical protein K8I02_12480 [Candidatus Methylomirabilis sp.]|nr:hypothetical protein [Deltaproteobacteria bacterium]
MSPKTYQIPFTISRCESGCVCLHFGVTVVHLRPVDFAAFMRQANGALRSLQAGPEAPSTTAPGTPTCH